MHKLRNIASSCALVLSFPALSLSQNTSQDAYTIAGTQILKNGSPAIFAGVNAFGTNGPNASSMSNFNINIVREAITDLSVQPVSGGQLTGTAGEPVVSLQAVVDDNRAHGKVTLLNPGYWMATGAQMAGETPSAQTYYADYKIKMRQIATQFKNQPDVWLEVWNEPYGGANPLTWLSDMKDMVDNIRAAGNKNIVVVPGSYFDSSEDVILSQGQQLLQGRSNLLFDLHGYVFNYSSTASTVSRVQALRNGGFAIMFAEDGPYTASGPSNPTNFLNAMLSQKVSTLLWIYKTDSRDANSLLTTSGAESTWGTQGFAFLASLLNGGPDIGGTVLPNVPYTIINTNSNRCVEVAGSKTANGSSVQQNICGSAQSNQEWRFVPAGDGYYQVENINAVNGVWDVRQGSNLLQIYQYGAAPNQQWMPVSLGNGTFKFVVKSSAKCLDVPGASTSNYVPLQAYTCNGTGAQSYQLVQQP
jgi:mannan endo-1,4-beta-mannosidase